MTARSKAIGESIVAGIVLAVVSYAALWNPVILAALKLRRNMPDAWFSALITWYAQIAILVVSLLNGAIAFALVWRQSARTGAKH
jgi:hypothetical protein